MKIFVWMVVLVGFVANVAVGEDRSELWREVEVAREEDQPQTEMKRLAMIEESAKRDRQWVEAVRAMVQRIAVKGRLDGVAAAIEDLEVERQWVPESARPVLRVLEANWLLSFYHANRWKFAERSSTQQPVGDDIESWDLGTLLLEVDRRMQAALANSEALQSIDLEEFEELLTEAEVEGGWRPTLFDFLVHQALDFYTSEEVAVTRPVAAFEVGAGSPVFASAREFLRWQPVTDDETSPKYRALRLYQDLLKFHRESGHPSAFAMADLERLRWANNAATEEGKEERAEEALREFIKANAGLPESAWARCDLALRLQQADRGREAHAVLLEGVEAFPDHPFGKLCRNQLEILEHQELTVFTNSHWTPAGEEIHVVSRNLNRVWFRMYSVPFHPGTSTVGRDPLPDRDKDLPAMLGEDPVREWSEALADRGDYDKQSSVFVAPVDLPHGYYVLVASAAEGFPLVGPELAVAGVHVTPLAISLSRHGDGGIEGMVVDAVDGRPLEGVEVEIWSRVGDAVTRFSRVTEVDGHFRGAEKQSGQCLVVARRGEARAVARIWSSTSRPAMGRRSHAVFFTDRKIYRPGQTVHFKGIWCSLDEGESNYEVRAKTPGVVRITGPKGKDVVTLEVVTNERGSFSGSFVAPDRGLLGRHAISLDGERGGASFQVEEYKRPKFFAEVDAPGQAVTLGDEVAVKLRAEAYTGAAIDGAQVVWRVTRATRLPGWSRWCWWWEPISPVTEEIAHGVGETAADGSMIIRFRAQPDRTVDAALEPVFSFHVTADVTDRSGETRTGSRQVEVAYTSFRASLRSEHWLEAGAGTTFEIETLSHDGEGRVAEGVLKLHRLQEPERCPRPSSWGGMLEASGEVSVDPSRWKPGEVVEEWKVRTDEGGKAIVNAVLDAGVYRLVFESRDGGGREVKAMEGIQVLATEAQQFSTPRPFFSTLQEESVEPGAEAHVWWGSGYASAHVCVEWYQQGVLLKREWSDGARTQQVFSFPITSSNRGGLTVVLRQVSQNRFHQTQHRIEVPWSDKKLDLHWERMVSKLEPGGEETWTAVIEGEGGEAAAAEMVATLYDASLDAFASHGFESLEGLLRRESGFYSGWVFGGRGRALSPRGESREQERYRLGSLFRGFREELGLRVARAWGFAGSEALPMRMSQRRGRSVAADSFAELDGAGAVDAFSSDALPAAPATKEVSAGEAGVVPLGEVVARKNLQETAFFFPNLVSDEDGKVRMGFTVPEALTRWRFLGFAHDSDFRSGLLMGEAVTSKELMVQPNPPRFLREGDELEFAVKVTNLGEGAKEGTARLDLVDAVSDVSRNSEFGIETGEREFKVPAKQSRTLRWRVVVPEGAGFLKYRAVASSGDLSDGEEGWLPVLSKQVLVTESRSFAVRGPGLEEVEFAKLLECGEFESPDDQFLQVQVVSQPAWYAVMALPYLMEFPHECSEQVFNRYYANALGRHLVKSNPKIRRVFDLWKHGGVALDSPLKKDPDLQGVLLEETPWLLRAENEGEARRRVGLLFDDNRLDHELERAWDKLSGMQLADGMWPWFPGGRGSEFVTLHVATGFARMRDFGVPTDITPALKAVTALDADLTRRYERLLDG
ncbi:MAG: alpha-2-macroglobulin family protein, partial [Verrucomicrobiales bacterium]